MDGYRNLLSCPRCPDAPLKVSDNSATCSNCIRSYPIRHEIFDFRDHSRDRSVGFDFEADNRIADLMLSVYARLTTFNELLGLYRGIETRLSSGIALDMIDPEVVLSEDRIVPSPMSAEDLGHGRAIVDKIPLYLETTDLPALRPVVALEDGAGQGFHVVGFAERFDHLFVLDLSLPYVLLARKAAEERGLANVTLICGSVENLPLRSDSIDFVHSNNVIEHVADQPRLFAETARVVSPDGLVFVQSPNRFSLYFEPHFRLPGFGFFPRFISRRIIRKMQDRDISDIALRSLGEVKALANAAFGKHVVTTFLPRNLNWTSSGGLARKLVIRTLNNPTFGRLAHLLMNRVALGVMPYHVLLCTKRRAS